MRPQFSLAVEGLASYLLTVDFVITPGSDKAQAR